MVVRSLAVTRGAIGHSKAICQGYPRTLVVPDDGKGRYDASVRNEVRDPRLVIMYSVHRIVSYIFLSLPFLPLPVCQSWIINHIVSNIKISNIVICNIV